MADIKRKVVEDSKSSKVDPAKPAGIEVNWGNAEKIKILLLQAINNHLVELVKLMKDVKEEK